MTEVDELVEGALVGRSFVALEHFEQLGSCTAHVRARGGKSVSMRERARGAERVRVMERESV